MKIHHNSLSAQRAQSGFALIEALVSLLIVAFGLLALASFQFTLSRASDLAKQRTEATRIAQHDLDRLRSFGQRQSDGSSTNGRYTYVDDVVTAGPQQVTGLTTNTTYTLTRTVNVPSPAPTSGDRFRWINVVVGWADRAGQQQSVQLASVISDGDPSDLGALGVVRRPSTTLRPKNRNINVPYPAVNLATCPAGAAGGCSAFVPPPGNVAYVFDNVTGNVRQSCTLTNYPITALTRSGTTATATASGHPFAAGDYVTVSGVTPAGYNGNVRLASINTPASGDFRYAVANSLGAATVSGATVRWALTEGVDLTALGGVTCTTFSEDDPRYLLSGYVRFFTGSNVSADDLINTNGNTFDLELAEPLRITTSGGDAPRDVNCYAQRQKVVSANVNNQVIRNISAYSRVNDVVTLTVGNHNFVPGMVVAVTGTSNYVLQGRFEIASVTSTTLSYIEIGSDTTDSTGRVELIQNLTLAESDPVPSAYNATISTFVAYTCIVRPSTTGTPKEWWGRLDLRPETSSSGGRVTWSTSDYRVCRYSADYNSNGLSNSDHPSYYRQVTGALDNQNFGVIRAAASCPTDTAPTYSGNQAGDFNNTNTVAHQPGSPTLSATEPASTSTPLPMQ